MNLLRCCTLTCVACHAFLATLAASAAADPLAQVNLQWQAPAPCPDASVLQAQLRRDLEGSLLPSEPLDVQAIVEQASDDDWRVRIHTWSAAGQSDRSLSARSCEPLADATSLIIAMMIDPDTAATHARVIAGLNEPAVGSAHDHVALPSTAPAAPLVTYPGQLPPPTTASARRGAADSETKTIKENPPLNAQQSAAPARVRTRGFASEWVMRDWGSLASATEVFGGSLGLGRGPWSGEVSLGVSLREDITQSSGQTIGSLHILTGALRLCYRAWEHGRVAVSPCAGLEWARWSSEGNSSLANHRDEVVLTSAADARLVGSLAVSQVLSLLLPLDVLLPLRLPSFGYTAGAGEQVEVFQPSWIAFRAGVGVQLHFP